MTKNKLHSINLLIILFMSILYSVPLFMKNGVIHYADQDTIFHLSRIIGLSNVWESPVNFNNFHNHGTMMNNFYPWLTLYPAYMLFKLTNNLTISYQIYYFAVTIVTMLIAYYSMHVVKKNPFISLIFALTYSFAAYRTSDIFQRASLGEVLALTFLPLILAGCIEVFFGNYHYWTLITIGMTLVLYSHLLSVMMIAVIMSVAILFSFYFWDNKWKRIQSLFYATICTLFLSIGFLLPFIQQNFSQEVKVPNPRLLVGMSPFEMIGLMINNNLYGYTIGSMIFVSVFYTLFKVKQLNNIDKSILYFGVIILLLSTNLFPWKILDNTPFASIQFVWRLNIFSTLFIAYSASVAFCHNMFSNSANWKKIMTYSLLLITLHASSLINLYYASKDYQTLLTEDIIFESASTYFHTDYANKDSVLYSEVTQNNLYFLDEMPVEVVYDHTDSIFTIKVDNPKNSSGNLITPIYRYLGQDIKVNNIESKSTLSRFGTTEVVVPPGQSIIEISYHYTTLAVISKILNGIFAIGFIIYIYFAKKRRKLLLSEA